MPLVEAEDLRARALRLAVPTAPTAPVPSAPAVEALAPPTTTGLLAAPGTPPAAQIPPAIPTERAPDESLGAFWLRRGITARAARPAGRAQPERSGL